MIYKDEETFDKINFTETPFETGEYDRCTFVNCDLSHVDLSDCKFDECTFIKCNLSVVKLKLTALREVNFKDCKLLGLRFDDCNEFGLSVSFDTCVLNLSSFYKTRMIKTIFKNCQLKETDFTECDLTSAVFDNCDLSSATFDHSNIEKADFRTSYNYSIDLENNKIKKAKFSYSGILGLLDKYDIEIDRAK